MNKLFTKWLKEKSDMCWNDYDYYEDVLDRLFELKEGDDKE